MEVHRSSYYYKKKRDDSEVIEAINKKVGNSTDGFWKVYCRLRNDGHKWNHKRVYRVYKLMNLNYRRKLKRRFPVGEKETIFVPNDRNISWSMDFDSLTLYEVAQYPPEWWPSMVQNIQATPNRDA